ncbi:MAG: anti-sigma regulatory factor [Tenericutes bacterium HGW-Tenericutes-2]|jgi:anti-sigma regulatory factor (Ser/Thr protein kinase)|nr:MAG: anti-sigma regulatory factor [Tenericutes bacterium HGW-Tenericutes-2]
MVAKEYQIIAKNYEFAGRASSDIKKTLKRLEIDRNLMKRVCSASYEAEINVVIHSFGGFAVFQMDESKIVLDFIDDGPGIQNIDLAMTEGYSTATELDHSNGFGAGMGLPNIKRIADEMDLRSDHYGTHLKITFYLGGDKNASQ